MYFFLEGGNYEQIFKSGKDSTTQKTWSSESGKNPFNDSKGKIYTLSPHGDKVQLDGFPIIDENIEVSTTALPKVALVKIEPSSSTGENQPAINNATLIKL